MVEDDTLIELAGLSDATEIAIMSKNDIEHGLGWDYTPEKITKLIEDRTRNVIVAQRGNNLVGFGIMTYRADYANLDLLAVKRGYRRLNIGTGIVLWLEKVAVTAGIALLFVQVRHQNRGATEFYKELGFVAIDEAPGYYRGTEAALIMSKSLRPLTGTA